MQAKGLNSDNRLNDPPAEANLVSTDRSPVGRKRLHFNRKETVGTVKPPPTFSNQKALPQSSNIVRKRRSSFVQLPSHKSIQVIDVGDNNKAGPSPKDLESKAETNLSVFPPIVTKGHE